GEEQVDVFHLLESGTIRRQHGLDGRLIACEVVLSPWVFNAIKHKEVLTLHRDYFRLRKPLERRIYELARKFCGQQAEWKISLQLLHTKSGSRGDEKEFRRVVRDLARSNRHFPDYYVHFDADDDMVVFNNRDTMKQRDDGAKYAGGMLKFETYSEVKNVVGNWPVEQVEQDWRKWVYDHDMAQHIKNPDAHFISFATSWYKKRGDRK
ncbi:MAG: plasmid replication initiator, partial [Acinetobacter sp.]|nr:plasmid replication initiator [Acinetobacter sp.]